MLAFNLKKNGMTKLRAARNLSSIEKLNRIGQKEFFTTYCVLLFNSLSLKNCIRKLRKSAFLGIFLTTTTTAMLFFSSDIQRNI